MSFFQHIETRNELADFLGIPRKKLTHLLYVQRIENCYHMFEVPKRAGGTRVICAPTGDLKSLQRSLARRLQEHCLRCREERGLSVNIAHAFQPRRGIITNAYIHRNKRYVFNTDLEDFFGSIHFGRIRGYFQKNEYFQMPAEVATILAQLCCYQGKLPQGAPTSPVLSNLICEILDFRILKIAKHYKLDYTRYADDLTFSTNDKTFCSRDDAFYQQLQKEIRRAGFAVNEKKTRLEYRDARQTVTGLVVNRKLSVDRCYCRETRAMAHTLYKTGEYRIQGAAGTMAQLEGRFAFINQLDRYENKHSLSKPRDFKTLNGRERQYQKFLFYRYFYANTHPLIVTEGKTDILYLKAALMNLHRRYPELVVRQPDGTFAFQVRFLHRSKRLRYFFDLSLDGADAMKNLYELYTGKGAHWKTAYYPYFLALSGKKPQWPVILVYDNEINDKTRPISKLLHSIGMGEEGKERLKKSLKEQLVAGGNLYLVTHPLAEGKSVSEIEDLFAERTRAVVIDGRGLSLRDDYDPQVSYGKDAFSKYVLSHYQTIDFVRFIPLLDRIRDAVAETQAAEQEPEGV